MKNILIVEDHPLIIEGYQNAFNRVSELNSELNFKIKIARNCKNALIILNNSISKNEKLDIVFLDIRLPDSSINEKVLSGEDLGIKIRKLFPETKIVISTSLNDNYRIHSIFRSIDPDAFLIKTDLTSKELVNAINVVITSPPYYTMTVMHLLRKKVSNNLLLDDKDRRILYELSIGTKMKELPNIIPLSIAGIEKRKRHLKCIFRVKDGNDRNLIVLAKEKGFI